jgi:ribosome recycling factor
MLDNIIKDAESGMQKAIGSLKNELSKLRTGRANTGLVEGVKVDYYGNATPLKNVANISVSDAKTITVTPWEKNMVKVIEKAIATADLGLNPVSDANLVRVPIPPLTEERRKEIIKIVKNIAETTKISIRNVRREAMDKLKDLLKKKEIDEDQERRTENLVQETTNRFVAEVDKLASDKEQDLMKV